MFDKLHASHVLLHRHILPACRLLKIVGVRGKSKVICLKKLAESLIAHNYVTLDADIKASTSDEVRLVSERNLPGEILAWQESNQNKENKPTN